MVCTLLAGVNVVAFAADDAETVSVSKFYNDAKKGGDGEHLFTKDADEISWLSSLKTWNNEGVAWKAPVSSSTSVWRCYNPNSGEHLYVDEGYADYLAGMGWNKEKVAFYSDDNKGVPVYRLWNGQDGVGSHHFTTDAGEVDWLVSQGWTKEDVAFYGVADASKVIALVDKDGLQADGTALVGDDLAIVYGSEYGTPKTITWYVNGATFKVFSGDALNNGFAGKAVLGSMYATVENTEGTIYKTNEIVVSAVAVAELSDYTISDGYDVEWDLGDANPISVSALDDQAIIDVTVNREYASGTFYLMNVTDPEEPEVAGAFDITGATEVYDEDDFTNQDLYDDAEGIDGALCYGDLLGEHHYKIAISEFNPHGIQRGDSYALLFDPLNQVKPTKAEDFAKITAMALPQVAAYVEAPEELTVSMYYKSEAGTGGAIVITATGADDKELTWWTDVAEDVAVIGVYSISTMIPDPLTDTAVAGAFADDFVGGMTIVPGDGHFDKEYAYATMVTDEGIFGEDALTLVSNVTGPVEDPASAMTLEESEKSAADAVVTLYDLDKYAEGSVVILQGNKDCDFTDANVDITKATVKGMARVSRQNPEVTIKNVFKNSDIKGNNNENQFLAVFKPDDTETFNTMKDMFIIENVETTYTLQPGDYVAAKLDGLPIKTLNQFGVEFTTDTAIDPEPFAFVQVVDMDCDNPTLGRAANGTWTLTANPGTGKNTTGDKWALTFDNGQVLNLTVKQATAGGTVEIATLTLQ